ncbi:MAG: M12 family metallo-peptidase [Planctomycetota bacterium]
MVAILTGSLARAQQTAVLPDEPISEEMVNQAFGLIDCELIDLNLPAFHDGPLSVTVPFSGSQYVLALSPHSNRSDRYEVRVHGAGGIVTRVAPGPILTKRGVVVGREGSAVAASLAEGLEASLFFQDGSSIHVVPVSQEIAGAPAGLHAVYHGDSVLARPENRCGVDDTAGEPIAPDPLGGSAKMTCSNLWVCELAIETDYEYYVDLGSVSGVESRINAVINAVNLQYERDVNIAHAITLINVYTSNSDAYTSSDPETLLTQFLNEWNANHTGDLRDVAHMFTGRNLSGSVIGIAYLRVLCSAGTGYSLVENISGSSCRADLSAHELGHNWSGIHCDCPSNTMNAYLTCANVFSAITIYRISSYRDWRACLHCDVGDTCQLDVGYGGPGSGNLSLCGGDLSSGTTADLEMTGGSPGGAALIQVGLTSHPTSFKGGLLVPVPGVGVGPLVLDGNGSLTIPGIQGGGTAVWYVQVIYEDSSLPSPSIGLTNALRVQMLP